MKTGPSAPELRWRELEGSLGEPGAPERLRAHASRIMARAGPRGAAAGWRNRRGAVGAAPAPPWAVSTLMTELFWRNLGQIRLRSRSHAKRAFTACRRWVALSRTASPPRRAPHAAQNVTVPPVGTSLCRLVPLAGGGEPKGVCRASGGCGSHCAARDARRWV